MSLDQEHKRMKHVYFNRHRQLNREVRQRTKSKREAYWNIVAAKLEDATPRNEYKALYKDPEETEWMKQVNQ